MKYFIQSISAFLIILFTGSLYGQCAPGEVEVEIIVQTDDYGYEGYWQLLPSGNECDVDMVDEGGNTAVGCDGAGAQNQATGGYANNVSVNEGPWCLAEGSDFDIIYTDDWGDGGLTFEVIINGYTITTFDGVGLGATFTFTANEPAPYDLSVFGSNLYQYVNIGAFPITADIFNAGTETITSFDLNYSVNGGDTITSEFSGENLANYQSDHFTHPVPMEISALGVYTIEIWASNLNGNEDENPDNDVYSTEIEVGPGTQNIIDQYVNSIVTVEVIADSDDDVNSPTDLDFHPVLSNKELWVINKDTENSGGSTVTIYNAGESNQTSEWKRDGNAWHFMSLPTGIAFSNNGNFANSPGVYDANHNGGDAFTGPALWSSDMNIYAEPSGGNGSHLDMLHVSPYSQGIAAEVDNVFWVFDGYNNDIVRYDFAEDHGPGNSYHGDALIRRFSDDEVAKDPNDDIVSHLVLDSAKQWLYVVDHGNQRVIRIDITTGEENGTPSYGPFETVEEYSYYTGYTQEDVVTTGLDKPAGIDVIGERMIISEYESGYIKIYDISTMPAVLLDSISTNYSSLQGIKIGPEGFIYGVDYDSEEVFKIHIGVVSVKEHEAAIKMNLYPNPTKDSFTIQLSEVISGTVQISDNSGRIIETLPINGNTFTYDSKLAKGLYLIRIQSVDNLSIVERLLVN